MPFVNIPGIGPMWQPETPATTSEIDEARSRTVWALSVPVATPGSAPRDRVLWLGDQVFQTGATCAYCQQLELVDCPGLHSHAEQYAQRFANSQADPNRKITITWHEIAPGMVQRAEVIKHIERTLAAMTPTNT